MRNEKLPFTEGELAHELQLISDMNPNVDNWPKFYSGLLQDCFPGVMSTQEWENRLRATGRQHHMHQENDLGGVRNPEWASWYAHDFVTRWNENKPLYDHVKVKLAGEEGNAFRIMGAVASAMQINNVAKPAQEQYLEEARSGDYDHLLQVTQRYVSVQ